MVGILPYRWKRIQFVADHDDDDLSQLLRQLELSLTGRDTGDRSIIPLEIIERRILFIRGEKSCWMKTWLSCMAFDESFEPGGEPKRRSLPSGFHVQVTDQEVADLRSQIVTSRSHGGRRYRPHAFAEQGVAMLSSVLRSKRAVQVNVQIMRTFVQLRQMLRPTQHWRAN